MKELNKQELIDIIYGCTVLGTGGGGSLENGLKIIEGDIEKGEKFYLQDLDEIPDDAYVVCPYGCGAISPDSEEQNKLYENLPIIDDTEALLAYRTMENYFEHDIYGVIATELGGENTADAFHVAAQTGKVIVDADPAGRSVPGLQHSTFYINDISITPMALATSFGDTVIVENVANDFRAEELVRSMAVVSKDLIGVVDHPVQGKYLKKAVIPGSISFSLKIGKALRESIENGQDPASNIVSAADGKILFRGRVKECPWDTVDGFTIGSVTLDGIDDFKGMDYKVDYKNEHIVSYLNGKIDVTVPDLICILDKEGTPVTNPYYEKGMELVIFALPSPKAWTTDKGLEVFGPKSFGYDIEYIPFDKK